MVAYNHGPFLAQAIEGVLAQKTDFAIELLVGEDCSKDDTREVALRYQRKHPQLVRLISSLPMSTWACTGTSSASLTPVGES
jgi:glycosyltransferase involved in cell wall biosynthesis